LIAAPDGLTEPPDSGVASLLHGRLGRAGAPGPSAWRVCARVVDDSHPGGKTQAVIRKGRMSRSVCATAGGRRSRPGADFRVQHV
jgi:hypothetical protein